MRAVSLEVVPSFSYNTPREASQDSRWLALSRCWREEGPDSIEQGDG